MFKKLSVGCLLFLCLIASGLKAAPIKQQRIVGGYNASENQWPWMVSLSYSAFSASQLFCGGSLIAQQWVLTAAHCLHQGGIDADPDSFVVYIGGYHLYDNPGQLATVEQIIVHPSYNESSSDNDLALIKLTTPVAGVNILPLLSAIEMNNVSVGDNATVIGWGSTVAYDPADSNPGVSYPDVLQEVVMPLVSNSTCNFNLGSITDNMLCAGLEAGGVDSCQGDSGGPLMILQSGQWYQLGIVSWGAGCASAGYYGVYTKIPNYIDWIEGYIFDLGINDKVFPPIVAGQSMTLPMSIRNNTATALDIQSMGFTSGQGLNISNNQCGTLNAAQTCYFDLSYSPAAAGSLNDQLIVNTSSPDFPTIQANISGLALNPVPVNSMVGNPNPVLVWGSGGDASWMQDVTTGTEGDASVKSGAITDNQSSWLVAHVNLSTDKILYFDWKVSSEKYFDGVELLLDGEVVDAISGEIKWKQSSVNVPAGSHVLHWRYRKDVTQSVQPDTAWIDNLSWDTPAEMQIFGETGTTLIYQVLSGELAVGSPGLSWSTTTMNPWNQDATAFSQGSNSLGSGVTADGEQSVVRALVQLEHSQLLSFDVKVSSEPIADHLAFFIDGVQKFEFSGEKDWQNFQYPLEPGLHTMLWVYTKDGAASSGQDKAWLDNVKLSETDHGNESGGGATGFFGLFMLFLYAYMNPYGRKKRIN